MKRAPHLPVMLREALEALGVRPGGLYIDGTFGAGGHSRAILAADGRVLAIDRDPLAEGFARELQEEVGDRLLFAKGNFRNLKEHLEALRLERPHGILLDLGVSSMHLDMDARGFGFRQEGPLDMRMGPDGESAAEVVNSYSQEKLAEIIYRYGEERHSRRIARAIVQAREERPVETTLELAEIVRRSYPPGPRRDHPARRTFQALRIYVNDELGALEDGLKEAAEVLAPHGRLVVISYHSLEDRIVKHFLRASPRFKPLHKRPLTASEEEIIQNPRARAAKLRGARVEAA